MRRLLRILAGLALLAAVIAVVRRLVTGGPDTAPAAVPWTPLESNDVVQPAPTTILADDPAIDTDTGASAGSVVAEPPESTEANDTDESPLTLADEAATAGGASNSATPGPTSTDSPTTLAEEALAGEVAEERSDAPDDSASPGADDDADWTEANEDGSCPSPFPVKANMNSKIFHVPGGLSYERTNAQRCYLNAAAAEADGLRQAKR